MKVAGIIAEYNPFHNGHQYQIEQVRKLTGADYIIIAMSGDFVQRGVPAIVDKYTRARMALLGGADLVLELPAVWTTASAEYFAAGGVQLLGKTGVVDTLCYGAEQPDSPLMREIIALLTNDSNTIPYNYEEEIRALIKQGFTYPAARARALCPLLSLYTEADILTFLNAPNNILALEYEKAIAKWNLSNSHKLQGYGIQRIGGGYHDESIHHKYSSASAIRSLLLRTNKADAADTLRTQVPSHVYEALTEAATLNQLRDTKDFSAALYARLWTYRKIGYTQFADCSTELSNKIINHLDQFTSFTDFATQLKTREITYTRVCRALLHILLDIHQTDYGNLWQPDGIPYLRVLGFQKASTPLLSAIKQKSSVPLITKVADASVRLSDTACARFLQDISVADLYRGVASIQTKKELPNEYQQPLCII